MILKNQEKNKKSYNKNKTEIEFETGEKVLIKNPIQDLGKFSKKYKGPFEIIKKLSPLNYVVRIELRNGLSDEIIHVRRLKKYTEPEKENNKKRNVREETSEKEMTENDGTTAENEEQQTKEKKKRGRPKKLKVETDQSKCEDQKKDLPSPTKRKVGRPKKTVWRSSHNKINIMKAQTEKKEVGPLEKFDKNEKEAKLRFANIEEYVNHMRTMVQSEKECEKEKYEKAIMREVRIEWKVGQEEQDTYTGKIKLYKKTNSQGLQENDEIKIFGQDDFTGLKAEIKKIERNEIIILAKTKKQLNRNLGHSYTIIPQFRNSSYDRMMSALGKLEKGNSALSEEILKIILEPKNYAKEISHTICDEKLNKHQNAAVNTALCNPLTLIQGPPGTGKTTTAVTIVKKLIETNKIPLLVCAPSNVATDNLATVLQNEGIKVLRVRTRNAKKERENEEENNDITITNAQVICTTCINAGNPILADTEFSATLIDESAMASEPEILVPIVKTRDKIILVGDTAQLRPTITSAKAQNLGMEVSMFERLEKTGYDTCMLREQYRMKEDMAKIMSTLFYENAIITKGEKKHNKKNSVKIIECRTDERQETGTKSYYNEGEAQIVVNKIKEMREAGVQPEEIGVITPYNAQKCQISNTLGRHNIKGVEIENIDKFQGREKKSHYCIMCKVE